jgi:hypothetical protein
MTGAGRTAKLDEIREEWLHYLADVYLGVFNPCDPRDSGLNLLCLSCCFFSVLMLLAQCVYVS